MTRALTDRGSTGSNARTCPGSAITARLTSYGEDFKLPAAFLPQNISNGFGEYLASRGLKQLRIAETKNMPRHLLFQRRQRNALRR